MGDIDIVPDIIEAIGEYANTPDHKKEKWIIENSMATKYMLNYLINITKDR